MRVYIFSPIPYSFLHQRPQQLANQLRRHAIDVTFIEPFGLSEVLARRKTVRFRDILQSVFFHVAALLNMLPGSKQRGSSRKKAQVSEPEALEILSIPLILPSNRVNSAFLDRLNASVLRAWLLRTVLGRDGCREGDVALIQQPYFGAVLRKSDFTRMYYDSIDDLSVFAGHGSRERLSGLEDTLLGIVDAVFVTSELLELELRQRKPGLTPVRIPNGVDYDRFQELAAISPVAEGLHKGGGPIAGYVGILRSWFDAELIDHLARRNPHVNFVLVGPYKEDAGLARLQNLPNVVLTGRVPHEDVPSFIQSFDVCMIPFRQGEISESTNPVKVFEYFALGKPVVSTRLRELVPFHKAGLLCMSETAEGFADCLHSALKEHDPDKQRERRAVAKENSWENHTRRMLAVMQNTRGID